MMKISELKTRLFNLEAKAEQLKAKGALIDASIDSSKPGGTARGKVSRQYRLRAKGKPAKYLKAAEVEPARAAIARGKALVRLQQEIDQLKLSIKVFSNGDFRLDFSSESEIDYQLQNLEVELLDLPLECTILNLEVEWSDLQIDLDPLELGEIELPFLDAC